MHRLLVVLAASALLVSCGLAGTGAAGAAGAASEVQQAAQAKDTEARVQQQLDAAAQAAADQRQQAEKQTE
jgi:hypothetical protein